VNFSKKSLKLLLPGISVVIIAKNEERLIADAIKSSLWADEVILLDTGSVDSTKEIAKKFGAKVISLASSKISFAEWHTKAIKLASREWLFYLDADERILPQLKKEISYVIKNYDNGSGINAFAVPRNNYYFGRRVRYGGSWPDYVKRLFRKKCLKNWVGVLHEEPVFEGSLGHLTHAIEHYTHRDITSMIEKTTGWSKLEAEELDRVGHPPMVWWRFIRPVISEFWYRGIRKGGFLDGEVGLVEVIFQTFSRFITYARLWEIQEMKSKKT